MWHLPCHELKQPLSHPQWIRDGDEHFGEATKRVEKQLLRRELWHHDLCLWARAVKSGKANQAEPGRDTPAHAEGYRRCVLITRRGSGENASVSRCTCAGAPGHGGGWGGGRPQGYKHHLRGGWVRRGYFRRRSAENATLWMSPGCEVQRWTALHFSVVGWGMGWGWRGSSRRKSFHSASYGGNNTLKCVLHGDYVRQWCSRCEVQMGIRASYCRFTGVGVEENSHERYLCHFCFAFPANILGKSFRERDKKNADTDAASLFKKGHFTKIKCLFTEQETRLLLEKRLYLYKKITTKNRNHKQTRICII